jgi:hypothetical protein
MRRELIITLETHDTANPEHIMQACNLLGGLSHFAETATVEQDVQKAHNRIRGNQFTFGDVLRVVEWVKRRAQEIDRGCYADQIMGDPTRQAHYIQGVRASTSQAVRLAEEFLADLQEDIRAHVES